MQKDFIEDIKKQELEVVQVMSEQEREVLKEHRQETEKILERDREQTANMLTNFLACMRSQLLLPSSQFNVLN